MTLRRAVMCHGMYNTSIEVLINMKYIFSIMIATPCCRGSVSLCQHKHSHATNSVFAIEI